MFANLQPSFTDPGYSFSGWNTTTSGSGVVYKDGSQYSFTSDMSLYAQWTLNVVAPVNHTVTFKENESEQDSVTAFETESSTQSLTLLASLQPAFTDPGYSFSGWNTTASGSGLAYTDGSLYSFTSDINLYAQWILNVVIPITHTVIFNENDSTTDSVSSSMSEDSMLPLTLFASLRPAFVDPSHVFSAWNTAADGSGTSYLDGAQYSFKSDLVLYAQWTQTTVDTFSFNANGGSGTITSISDSSGSTLTLPGQSGLIRAGFVLVDWNTSANGSGTKYLVGQVVTVSKSIDLYAQWTGHKLSTLFGAIGTFKAGSSSLSEALKSQILRVALTIRARKYVSVDLYGYTGTTGLQSLNMSLSRARARNVATYLRVRLAELKDRGVTVDSTGEGAIAGQSSNSYSRVEVFGI
jgi:uncharacterized repeat protein (TIGR02543 family)